MKKFLHNFFVKLTALATIASSIALSAPASLAISPTDTSFKFSRLKASTATDLTVTTTLPAGIDFDHSPQDKFAFVMDDGADHVLTTGWAKEDFTFNDGTERTVIAIAEGPGVSSLSCADGEDNVGVAIRTDAPIFYVHPCGASFVSSATGATITFTATDGGGGKLTNPVAGSHRRYINYIDEGSLLFAANTSVFMVDDDQVSASATVAPTLTFDIDSGTSQGSNNDGTHTIAIGTIVPGTTKSSDQSGINSIFIDLDTNATGGATVSVKNTNGANGLTSASVAADDIDSTDATMNATDENYGLCVESVTETQVASGSLGAVSPFDGATCTAGGVVNVVGGLDGTVQNILSVNDAIEGGRAEILVNASANAITTAHDDYADTLIFIATGTF